jgi:hypothetical protein
MNDTRKVLVHRRWRTVHEVRADGTSRCGNGEAQPGAYVSMQAKDVGPGARACARCDWIVERRPNG